MAKEKSKSRFRQKAKKGALKKRVEESYSTREDSGKYKSYVSSDIPLKQWKPDEGDHFVDIIPFLAGEHNPNGYEVDTELYRVEVYAHFGIGVNENAYVCPNHTIGERCPICELQAKMKMQGASEDDVKSLNAKRRCVYQVLVYDTPKTEAEGLMYWEASYHLTERNLNGVAKQGRAGKWIEFADPDDGKTVEFTKEGKGITMSFTGFKLTDRDYIIDDEVLEECVALGDYIEILDYEELSQALEGTFVNAEEEEEEEKPSRGRARRKTGKAKTTRKKVEEEEDEEDEEDPEYEEDEDPEEDEEEPEPEEEEEPEEDEEDEEEEKPKRRTRRTSKSKEEARKKPTRKTKEKEPEKERSTRMRRRRR
jgi:hypothetical protein